MSFHENEINERFAMKEKTISGFEAVRLMRQVSKTNSFMLLFITLDRKRQEGGYLRKYDRCRVRTAKMDELADVDPDHYLYFTDTTTGDPRTCWKKLIRYVGFPPKYELIKVDWYKK